jgi:hypothetical protein
LSGPHQFDGAGQPDRQKRQPGAGLKTLFDVHAAEILGRLFGHAAQLLYSGDEFQVELSLMDGR